MRLACHTPRALVAAYSATGKLDLLRGFLGRSVVKCCAGRRPAACIRVAVAFYHARALNRYMSMFGALTVGQVLAGYKDIPGAL